MEIKALETEIEEMKKELRKDLEEDFKKNGSAVKIYGSYTVSLSEQKRVLADPEALKEAGIFEKYCKPSIAETLKVVRNKG
jgi:membrane protease subunit (stomatin/prohibitin family)